MTGQAGFTQLITVVSATALLGVAGGCASRNFPVLVPETKISKDQLSRARAEEYFVKARDYDLHGLPQMAETFYKMAFDADPRDPVLRDLLAKKYVEAGKYTQALIVLREQRPPGDVFSEEEKMILSTVYIKTGQFERATKVIEQIKDKGPEKLYSLALLYESAGDLEKSLAYYLQFFDARNESLDIGLKIAGIMHRLGRFDELEQFLVRLEGIFGHSARLLNMLGLTNVAKGDTAQAVEFYRMALVEDSTCDDALRNLAQVYIQRNDYPPAIDLYRRLYNSRAWGTIYGKTLGLLYYYNDQYVEAQEILSELLASDIEDYELHYYLGLVEAELGHDDLSRLEFEKTVALRSTFEDGWRQLCYGAVREGDLDRAVACARRFTRALPESSVSWRFLGSMLNGRNDYVSAVDVLKKAIVIDSADVRAWFELGSALERLNRTDSAAMAFKKVLSLQPHDAVAANYLGYMWAEKGLNLDSAQILIEQALDIDPGNGAYLDSYAWVLYRRGEYERAYEFMKMALEHIENDPVVLEHFGDILERLDRPDAALEAYRRAQEFEPVDGKRIAEKIRVLENGE